MKLFNLNCPYRKREKNGNNSVRNKNSNSNISTPLKTYIHTVQTGISNQVLLIKLKIYALQNPTLQYGQKIFKKAYYWKVNSRKLASQAGSVIACTFFYLLVFNYTITTSFSTTPKLWFQDCFRRPTLWLPSQPLQYLPLSIQCSDTVTLISEDVLEAIRGSP